METKLNKKQILLTIILTVVATLVVCRVISEHSLVPKWTQIQTLTNADQTQTAKLFQLYTSKHANFKVVLNGKKLFWSPDIAPNHQLAFREFLTWDESNKILVLSVADKVVFAYDTQTQSALAPASFSALKLQRPTLKDLHYDQPDAGPIR